MCRRSPAKEVKGNNVLVWFGVPQTVIGRHLGGFQPYSVSSTSPHNLFPVYPGPCSTSGLLTLGEKGCVLCILSLFILPFAIPPSLPPSPPSLSFLPFSQLPSEQMTEFVQGGLLLVDCTHLPVSKSLSQAVKKGTAEAVVIAL